MYPLYSLDYELLEGSVSCPNLSLHFGPHFIFAGGTGTQNGCELLGSIKPFSLFFFFYFWLHLAACGISVPRPGIEPVPPASEAWSLNHWAAREFQPFSLFFPTLFWSRFISEKQGVLWGGKGSYKVAWASRRKVLFLPQANNRESPLTPEVHWWMNG